MSERDGTGIVVKVPRHFAGTAVQEIVGQVHRALGGGSEKLVFDFRNSETIDSFGIGQLVSLAKELKDKGVKLTLSNLNDDIFQLFMDTGLDRIFAIEGVKQDAIDLFESAVDIRLEISLEEAGDACIFRMSGVMDSVGGGRFFKQKFLLSLAKYRTIILDFSDLTFFDSLSVSVLLDMHKLLKETGGRMCIFGANYIIEDLFNTLNLGSVIPLFPGREEALSSVR